MDLQADYPEQMISFLRIYFYISVLFCVPEIGLNRPRRTIRASQSPPFDSDLIQLTGSRSNHWRSESYHC